MDLLVIAGEASGDEHSSILVADLLKHIPSLSISAIGGPCLEKKGSHLVYPLVDHAVVGVFEVLKNYKEFRDIFASSVKWIKEYKPKAILLVDYPGFNLRLAKELKKLGLSCKGGGTVKIFQYISPQLWAWKPKRRFVMEQILDGLGVLFPFEVDCYNDTQLPVSFVGHPFAQSSYQSSVRYDSNGPLLLLPGSRRQPVERILPVFLDAYEILLKDFPQVQASLPVPDSKIRKVVEGILNGRTAIKSKILVVEGDATISARAAWMSSGTMSLSCAVSGIPGVIAYRAHPLTYFLGRILVKIPYLGMANILLPDDPPYPEFIQGQANGKQLAEAMSSILLDNEAEEKSALVSEKLLKCLTCSTERGAAKWLIQVASLC